jgi:hypothetical protein
VADALLLAFLIALMLGGVVSFAIQVREQFDRRRWRRWALDRGLPLCVRCCLPEAHPTHGSYGDCAFYLGEVAGG